jgi:hypothetical protein
MDVNPLSLLDSATKYKPILAAWNSRENPKFDSIATATR